MDNFQELISQATTIKNEIGPRQNTALRVGSLLLEIIGAISEIDENFGNTNETVNAINSNTVLIKGITDNPDSLNTVNQIGLYYCIGNIGWSGFISVQKDFSSKISQIVLSSSTPTYDSKGNLGYKSKPCVMTRNYEAGKWTRWSLAGGTTTKEVSNLQDIL